MFKDSSLRSFFVLVAVFLIFVSSFVTGIGFKLYEGHKKNELKVFKSFIISAMAKSRQSDMSDAKKAVIVDNIVEVAFNTFDLEEHREIFVALIAIESAFNPEATSKAGAVGLTQVLVKYASYFSKKCGLPDINAEKDLKDVSINLRVGACAFKQLIDDNNGKITLALIGYNAGLSSTSVKQLKAGAGITNPEAASYSVKINYFLDEVRLATAE